MKKDSIVALVAVVAVLTLCFVLNSMRPNLPPTPSTPFSVTTGPKPSAPTERVVMRVNGEPITEREFDAFLQQAPEQMQAYYASPEGRKLLADQLVKLKALEQEGRRLGVREDPEAKSRINVAEANIVAAYALQKIAPAPTDARLRAEYEKEKKNFDSMELSHILIAYAGGTVQPRTGTPLPPDAAMKKAQQLSAQLRRGTDFAQVARAESDDLQSAQEGGRLGDVSPAALPPDVQGVVASLKANEISQPVKSQFGIHIFKSGAHTSRPYDQMKQMFAAKIQRDEAEAALNRLQKSAKVELDPQYFRQQSAPPRGRS